MGYLTLDQAVARIIHKISREPVKLRTLQRWIQQHADVVDKRFIKGKRQTHYLEEDDLAASSAIIHNMSCSLQIQIFPH